VSTFWRLLAEHGTATAALAALPGVAQAAGIPDYSVCPEGVIVAELKAAKRAGATMLCRGNGEYPVALCDLTDAPPILWAVGKLDLLQRPMIAMVGARNASSLGTRMARRMAEDLGQAGFVVVSGLARGVDAAAHLAALPTGTIAVMGGGVDVIYPAENTLLAEAIRTDGLILSEQPMGLQPQSRHFPARNRIISGLSQAVVVIEAAAKSGSLITARNALDQGRDVLAVPGHPFDARAAGCNMLLRDGAILARSAEDVIEALGAPERPPAPAPIRINDLPLPEPGRMQRGLRATAALHQKILDRLGPSPLAEDQLIRDLGASSTDVSPALVDLELDGQITRAPGGLLSRSH
jgi:DNA processing protein